MATQADIESHYDIDNDFFGIMLDKKYRAYSTGAWECASGLEDAQEKKFNRLCEYAAIRPGDKVLDIGSGWGGFMNLIAEKYPFSSVHGLTISREQFKYVNEIRRDNVSLDLCAWRDFQVPERKFDALVSVEVFEHFATLEESGSVRQREVYRDFFDWCLSVSTDDAHFALQTIVISRMPKNLTELNDTKFLLNKVFPGSALSSVSDINAAIVDKYEISAVSRMAADYIKTLAAWKSNLEREKELVLTRYGQEIYDHHIHYLEAARRCFESGYTDLYQISLKRAKPTRLFMS